MIKIHTIFRVRILILLLVVFHLHAFSQSKSSKILKVTITDSVRKYIEKELLSYTPGEYQLEMNISSMDIDTTPNLNKGNKSLTLADIKKQRKLLCNCGKDANVYLEIGSIYEHLNMYDSSIANLDRGLKWVASEKIKHPDSLNLLETEALIYSHKRDYATCIEKCEYILTKKIDDSIATVWLPILYMGVGDIQKLINYTNSEIKRTPDDCLLPVFFNLLGQSYLLVNDARLKDTLNKSYLKLPADSFVDFSSIYTLRKKYPRNHSYEILDNYIHLFAYYILKITTIDVGSTDPVEIINSFDTLHIGRYLNYFSQLEKAKWHTNKYSVYKGMALSHLLLHHVKEAQTYFRKAIDAFPSGTATFQSNCKGEYTDLALCYYTLRDTAGAENIVREAIRLKPGVDVDPYAYLMLGRSALLKRNFNEAKKNAEAALKLNSNYVEAFKFLAVKAIYEKDYKTALNFCDKAYALNKNDENVFVIGAIANLLSDSPDTAHTMLKMVHDYNPEDDFVNDILAHYFF